MDPRCYYGRNFTAKAFGPHFVVKERIGGKSPKGREH